MPMTRPDAIYNRCSAYSMAAPAIKQNDNSQDIQHVSTPHRHQIPQELPLSWQAMMMMDPADVQGTRLLSMAYPTRQGRSGRQQPYSAPQAGEKRTGGVCREMESGRGEGLYIYPHPYATVPNFFQNPLKGCMTKVIPQALKGMTNVIQYNKGNTSFAEKVLQRYELLPKNPEFPLTRCMTFVIHHTKVIHQGMRKVIHMGIRKTIYIQDVEAWGRVEAKSRESGLSTGAVLMGAFSKDTQLDRIEGMLKELLGARKDVIRDPATIKLRLPDDEPFVSPKEPKYVPSYSDGNIKPIPKDLPKEKKLEALKTYFNPMPKKKVNG